MQGPVPARDAAVQALQVMQVLQVQVPQVQVPQVPAAEAGHLFARMTRVRQIPSG